jgi:hypothetical protein
MIFATHPPNSRLTPGSSFLTVNVASNQPRTQAPSSSAKAKVGVLGSILGGWWGLPK